MLKKHTKHILLILTLILLLVLLYAFKNINIFVRIGGTILAIFIFYLSDFYFKLKFKNIHYFLFALIAISGILFSNLYSISPNYDKILHLISPILLSIIIFFLINKLKTTFPIKLLLTVSVVLSFLGLFEIGEYALDQLLGWKLQGVFLRDISGVVKLKLIMNRNDDTMIDLILGTSGILIFVLTKTIKYNYKKIIKK